MIAPGLSVQLSSGFFDVWAAYTVISPTCSQGQVVTRGRCLHLKGLPTKTAGDLLECVSFKSD